MAFGGYKFAGYRVDKTQYSSSIERCLAIHAARIRAFLNASTAAGNPWFADPDWLTGEMSFDASTGEITGGVNNGLVHVLIGEDGTQHGYSSYFKYSQNDVEGYYFIMTVNNYNIDYSGSDTQLGITLNESTIPIWRESNSYYGAPFNASCFHCFSKDPFGHAPSGQEGKDYRYLNLDHKGSSRLISIGYNRPVGSSTRFNSNSLNSNISSGFVGLDSGYEIVFFGYVIKDTDIISMCSVYTSNNYVNPFSINSNTHVTVMSLNGFSELYCKDDTYRFLLLNIKNGYYSSSSYGSLYDEVSCNGMNGDFNAILDVNGNQMPGTSYNRYYAFPSLWIDQRTIHTVPGANYIPFSGISVKGYLNSLQYGKGCTNPELLSVSVGNNATQNNLFSSPVDGNLLLIYRFSGNLGNIIDINGSALASESLNYDFFIGWDSSNPDIRTDAAWPEYNPTVSSLVV